VSLRREFRPRLVRTSFTIGGHFALIDPGASIAGLTRNDASAGTRSSIKRYCTLAFWLLRIERKYAV
jgi:hypothetical protein